MHEEIALTLVLVTGISAIVSAVSATFALLSTRTAVQMLKSKEGKIRSGPDIEENSNLRAELTDESDK